MNDSETMQYANQITAYAQFAIVLLSMSVLVLRRASPFALRMYNSIASLKNATGALRFSTQNANASEQKTQNAIAPVAHAQQKTQNAIAPEEKTQNAIAYLSHAQWWDMVHNRDKHLILVGATGDGKSTMARALLVERSLRHKIVVIDPHVKFNDWAGFDANVVGQGGDMNAIDEALRALVAEKQHRYAVGKEACVDSVSIFIDEWVVIKNKCPSAYEAFMDLLLEGRKVGLFLVLLTQSDSVKSLGIEGEGDVREGFARLLLGNFASNRGATAARHPAVLDFGGRYYEVDNSTTLDLSRRPANTQALYPLRHTLTPQLTAAHLKAAMRLGQGDRPGVREMARILYPGTDGSGDYAKKAKKIMAEVESLVYDCEDDCEDDSVKCEDDSVKALERLITA